MKMKCKGMRTLLSAAMLLTLLVGFGNGTLAQAEESQATAQSGTENAAQTAIPGGSIQTNGGEVIALSALEHRDEHAEAAVYYTSEISPEAMVALYNALGVELTGDRIAVKLSTGEPPASNYLDPNLIADLVHRVNGTIVENNTAYGGQRASTAMAEA